MTVRHVAAAPAVSVSADGSRSFPASPTRTQAKADVAAKSYAVAVAPASGGDAVLSTDLDVAEGVNTIVYAWGSLEDDNLAAAVQTIDGLHSAPGSVPAGEVGLASSGSPLSTPWALTLMVAAAATGLFAVRRLAQR